MSDVLNKLISSLGLHPLDFTTIQVEESSISATCQLPSDIKEYLKSSRFQVITTSFKNREKFFGINVDGKGCLGFYKPKEMSSTSSNYKFVVLNNKFCSAIEKFNEV